MCVSDSVFSSSITPNPTRPEVASLNNEENVQARRREELRAEM